MNDHPIDNHDSPSNPAPQKPENGAAPQREMSRAELQATCEQLRKKVEELEAARNRDQNLLAMKQMEVDGLLHIMDVFGKKPLSDDEFQECLRKSGCKTLDEFLPELEKMING